MSLTAGRSSLTAQTTASSYETCFAATAPAGAGSNGAPIRLMRFHAATETVTIKLTRFNGRVTEYIVPADKTREFGEFPMGFVKAEAKSAGGTGTLVWEDVI